MNGRGDIGGSFDDISRFRVRLENLATLLAALNRLYKRPPGVTGVRRTFCT